MIVAEGAKDKDGNKITSEQIRELLADNEKGGLALDTRITTLGHVQRGGTAVAYDRMLATLQGVEAVNAVLEATPETETCFIAINENKIVRKPLMKAVQETKSVAAAVEAKDFEKAMSLRDTEFSDQYKSYITTTNVVVEDYKLPEKKVRNDTTTLYPTIHLTNMVCIIAHENWLHQRRSSRWWHERRCSRRCRLLHFQRTRPHCYP